MPVQVQGVEVESREDQPTNDILRTDWPRESGVRDIRGQTHIALIFCLGCGDTSGGRAPDSVVRAGTEYGTEC